MKFILTAGWEDGIADLTQRLVHELAAGKQVLWLVSGGSNIPASVQVMGNISARLSRSLSIMLADERFGKAGHAGSNWTQLLEAGLKPKAARVLPILQVGKTFDQTVIRYKGLVEQVFGRSDSIIAQLGIGDDGHISGILPASPAAIEETALAIGYQSQPHVRLTLTFPALRRVNAAYAFAFGNTKHKALATLQDKRLEPSRQPAQILKQLPEAYLYSDQVGSHV